MLLYYFVSNSLVALLEALCARIFFFRFVNIGFFPDIFFFVCVCARSLTKPLTTVESNAIIIIIRICVQSTQVYVYAGTRDEILDYQLVFFNNFFLSTKEKKDVNAHH